MVRPTTVVAAALDVATQGAAAGARARCAADPARARADAHARAAAAGRAARRDGADAVGGPPDGRAGDRRPQQPGRDGDRHRRPGCRRPAPGRPRQRPRRRARAQRPYYLTRVRHTIGRDSYAQEFEGVRNAVGLTGAELFVEV